MLEYRALLHILHEMIMYYIQTCKKIRIKKSDEGKFLHRKVLFKREKFLRDFLMLFNIWTSLQTVAIMVKKILSVHDYFTN